MMKKSILDYWCPLKNRIFLVSVRVMTNYCAFKNKRLGNFQNSIRFPQTAIISYIIFLLFTVQTVNAQVLSLSENNEFTNNTRKIYKLFFILDETYIEDLNFTNLTEGTIKCIFENLDPYATYLTKAEVDEMKISFYAKNLSINDKNVAFLSKKEKSQFRYVTTSSIEYLATVIREGKPIESSLDVAYKMNDSIAYIKVNRFSVNTSAEIEYALRVMGVVKGLILDLRGNGGGLFNQGVATADLFLPIGKLISFTEGRKIKRNDLISKSNGVYEKGKMVILVDELTASASELVAGALQDWDRAVIIGRTTFGKGVVQQQVEFDDGSAMRVTIARYHTPTGRAIQKPYNLGIYGKRIHKADTTKYLSMLNKRELSAEGGIRPDIIIPRDSSEVTNTWVYLIESGWVLSKLTNFLDKNEKMLQEKYSSLDIYTKNFTTPSSLVDEIMSGQLSFDIARSQAKVEKMRRLVANQSKAAIAERLWGSGSYFKVLNTQSENKYITKSLEILK